MKKMWLLALAIMGCMLLMTTETNAAKIGDTQTNVFLTLSGGSVTFGSTWSIDLGKSSISSTQTTKEGTFTDNFWVEDLKGADAGWHTTLQVGDLIHQGDNSITIPAANISIKAGPTITTIAGTVNSAVEIANDLLNYQAIDTAKTFLLRNTASNGILGKYGVKPSIKVTIPEYQAVGVYKAILTYTLYED